MAHGTVTVIHPVSEQVKILPVGYAWTILFWGCFPALFRQDWKNFGIMAAVLVITGFLLIAFIPLIVFSFIYNDKMCLKDHLDSGWKIKHYYGSQNLEMVGAKLGYNLKKYMHTEVEG